MKNRHANAAAFQKVIYNRLDTSLITAKPNENQSGIWDFRKRFPILAMHFLTLSDLVKISGGRK
jgi:hypothetical protein